MPSFTKFLCAVNELVNIPVRIPSSQGPGSQGHSRRDPHAARLFRAPSDGPVRPAATAACTRARDSERVAALTRAGVRRFLLGNLAVRECWISRVCLRVLWPRPAAASARVTLFREAQPGLESPQPRQRLWRLQAWLGRGVEHGVRSPRSQRMFEPRHCGPTRGGRRGAFLCVAAAPLHNTLWVWGARQAGACGGRPSSEWSRASLGRGMLEKISWEISNLSSCKRASMA